MLQETESPGEKLLGPEHVGCGCGDRAARGGDQTLHSLPPRPWEWPPGPSEAFGGHSERPSNAAAGQAGYSVASLQVNSCAPILCLTGTQPHLLPITPRSGQEASVRPRGSVGTRCLSPAQGWLAEE